MGDYLRDVEENDREVRAYLGIQNEPAPSLVMPERARRKIAAAGRLIVEARKLLCDAKELAPDYCGELQHTLDKLEVPMMRIGSLSWRQAK